MFCAVEHFDPESGTERKSSAGGTSAQPEKLLRPFHVFTRVQRDDGIRDKALVEEENART